MTTTMQYNLFSLFTFSVLVLLTNTAFSQTLSADGIGLISIKNELIIYDDPGKQSNNTRVNISGIVNTPIINDSIDIYFINERFARIEVNSINGKKFQRPGGGWIALNADSTISFEISIYKSQFESSELKELPGEMEIEGNFIYYRDSVKHPIHISATVNPNETNIYTRLMKGDLEAEIGLKINPSIIKGLVLNYYQCVDANIPIDLSKFSSVETLFIRGLYVDDAFPEEIYKLRNIKNLTIDLTNLNSDGSGKHISACKFYLPKKVLELPKIKTLKINHVIYLNIPDIPEYCSLESFTTGGSKIDSIPSSFVNLKKLNNLVINGNIQAPLPDNLNEISSLDTMILNMPDALMPNNFGPWKHLKYVKLRQTNVSRIDRLIFEERMKNNNARLKEIFSTAEFAWF